MVRFVDVLAVCTIFVLIAAETGRIHNTNVVCYVEYENDFKIEEVDLNLCTHLIAIDKIWSVKFEIAEDPWTDSRDKSKDYKHLTKLRRKFPHLKVSLALKHNFRDYLLIAKSVERNQTFIRKATDFVLQQKFDGLDLIWDFSKYQEYNYKYIFDEKYDKVNFANFMEEFKASFQLHSISLTTTFIAAHEKILENIDMLNLSNHIDFVHFLQWYTFDGPNFGQYQLTLEKRGMRNMQKCIDCAVALGVPRSKIILGLQFLPTVFDHFSSDVEKFDYGYVCDLEEKYDAKHGLSTAKKPVPILWTFLPENERYIYESSRSIANKVRFAVRRNLGGVMAFSINYDDFIGKCLTKNDTFADFKTTTNITLNIPDATNTTFPLLCTINDAIAVAMDEKVKEEQIQIENKTDKSRYALSHDKIVLCYTLTRPDQKIITSPIENINLNLCTHLVCIDNIWNTTATEEPWQNLTKGEDYRRFTNLRQKYPHLKISMAVKHSLVDYLRVVSDAERQIEFIKNASEFILNNNFDGLDLFWDLSSLREHELHRNSIMDGRNFDKDAIFRFITELNLRLHQQNRTLTSTFIGINTELAKSLDMTALSKHFDLMSFVPMYDFRANPGNVALGMLNTTKMEQFIDDLIEMCVLPSKIAVGVQFMGHSFTHKTDSVQFEDTWGLSHACEMSKKLKVANLFIKKTPQQKKDTYYSLESENTDSIRRKVELIKSRNLAGITAYPVNFDDFLEKCEESDTKNVFADQQSAYPLLRAINNAISDAFLQSHETEVDTNEQKSVNNKKMLR